RYGQRDRARAPPWRSGDRDSPAVASSRAVDAVQPDRTVRLSIRLEGLRLKGPRLALALQDRDGEPELGTAFGSDVGPDPAAHRLDQGPGDVQPDAGSTGLLGGGRRSVEQLEEVGRLVGREAG